MMKTNILITGFPGVGKTTFIRKLIEGLKGMSIAGFYTAEIREEGERKGFELISLDGRRGILSHVDLRTEFQVGKYSVDVEAFESFLEQIPFFDASTRLAIIDEIGKMECYSKIFLSLLNRVFDEKKTVVATIALKGSGPIAAVKKRKDVELIEITRKNRELMPSRVKPLILQIQKVLYHEGRIQ